MNKHNITFGNKPIFYELLVNTNWKHWYFAEEDITAIIDNEEIKGKIYSIHTLSHESDRGVIDADVDHIVNTLMSDKTLVMDAPEVKQDVDAESVLYSRIYLMLKGKFVSLPLTYRGTKVR